jgi:putative oxidoreductase
VDVIRTIARPMLGAIFVVAGLDVLANPEPRAKLARPLVDRISAAIPIAPKDPVTAVTLNAIVHLAGGALLAVGVFPRLAALALSASMVPTTVGGHRFWEFTDPAQRSMQRTQFLKNTAIMGGLLITALD